MSAATGYSFYGLIASAIEAHALIEASKQGIIPRVTRRLTDSERKDFIKPGAAFVFAEDETGIRRWTHQIKWGPSRVNGPFLFYSQVPEQGEETLIKQSLSLSDPNMAGSSATSVSLAAALALHALPTTNSGKLKGGKAAGAGAGGNSANAGQKMHLVAYFNQRTVNAGTLLTVAEDPRLRDIVRGLENQANVLLGLPTIDKAGIEAMSKLDRRNIGMALLNTGAAAVSTLSATAQAHVNSTANSRSARAASSRAPTFTSSTILPASAVGTPRRTPKPRSRSPANYIPPASLRVPPPFPVAQGDDEAGANDEDAGLQVLSQVENARRVKGVGKEDPYGRTYNLPRTQSRRRRAASPNVENAPATPRPTTSFFSHSHLPPAAPSLVTYAASAAESHVTDYSTVEESSTRFDRGNDEAAGAGPVRMTKAASKAQEALTSKAQRATSRLEARRRSSGSNTNGGPHDEAAEDDDSDYYDQEVNGQQVGGEQDLQVVDSDSTKWSAPYRPPHPREFESAQSRLHHVSNSRTIGSDYSSERTTTLHQQDISVGSFIGADDGDEGGVDGEGLVNHVGYEDDLAVGADAGVGATALEEDVIDLIKRSEFRTGSAPVLAGAGAAAGRFSSLAGLAVGNDKKRPRDPTDSPGQPRIKPSQS